MVGAYRHTPHQPSVAAQDKQNHANMVGVYRRHTPPQGQDTRHGCGGTPIRFGEVLCGQPRLNEFGKVVKREWLRTPDLRPSVVLGEFVVMPDHFHAIVIIRTVGFNGMEVAQYRKARMQYRKGRMQYRKGRMQYAPTVGFRSPSRTVGAIVRGFKSATTREINRMRRTPGEPVWQRSYYEHIIRDEDDHDRIRNYIIHNPVTWTPNRP